MDGETHRSIWRSKMNRRKCTKRQTLELDTAIGAGKRFVLALLLLPQSNMHARQREKNSLGFEKVLKAHDGLLPRVEQGLSQVRPKNKDAAGWAKEEIWSRRGVKHWALRLRIWQRRNQKPGAVSRRWRKKVRQNLAIRKPHRV